MTSRCETIMEALGTISAFDELEAFSDTLRNPPSGCIVKPVTDQEWQAIAQKKIALQLKESTKR